jgi:hypothetical protein
MYIAECGTSMDSMHVGRKLAPVITGATGILTKDLKKNVDALTGKHSIESLQKTAIHVLGTLHTVRGGLRSEPEARAVEIAVGAGEVTWKKGL